VIRIAVDTSAVGPQSSGIGRYVSELVSGLRSLPGVEPVVGPAFNLWKGTDEIITGRNLVRSALATANGLLYEPLGLPRRVRRSGIDLYHASAARVPVRRLSIPIVATIHDFAAFELPTWQGRVHGWQLRCQVRRAVAAAALIIVPSETIREELAVRFPSAASRTRVVHHGVTGVFRNVRHGAPATPTFVSVATLERRKNLTTLLEAFARILSAHPASRLRLIGQEQNASGAIRQRLDRLRITDAVTTEGYVSDQYLAQAYAAATATVYPSLYEGFGLPILESMAAGAPVIASDRGAMREVAGEAALLVDPFDPGSLATAMLRLIEDPALHARLQNLGRERAARFTWEKCAGAHMEAYRQLAQNLA
jgi:glycosyltransferase involved in cell wall biosynthesis